MALKILLFTSLRHLICVSEHQNLASLLALWAFDGAHSQRSERILRVFLTYMF